MSSALSPELALDYLRELSPSVTSCALVADGELVCGDASLVAPTSPALVVRDGDTELVAVMGREAPRALVEFDMRHALAAVRGRC